VYPAEHLLTVEATMISHRDIAEILPAEDSTPKDIKLAPKIHPFHTDSLTYSQRERAFITVEATASLVAGSGKTVLPCLARTSAICVTAAPISTQEWMTFFQEMRECDRPREVPADSVRCQRCDRCTKKLGRY
jgi:hypothetical protein